MWVDALMRGLWAACADQRLFRHWRPSLMSLPSERIDILCLGLGLHPRVGQTLRVLRLLVTTLSESHGRDSDDQQCCIEHSIPFHFIPLLGSLEALLWRLDWASAPTGSPLHSHGPLDLDASRLTASRGLTPAIITIW